jgi:amidase
VAVAEPGLAEVATHLKELTMNLDEYSRHDGTGLAELIRSGEVTADEVHATAVEAIAKVQPEINAVAAAPFIEPLDYSREGRFAGVPFALKDLVCHAKGIPTRMGSRLTGPDGVIYDHDTELMSRFRKAGLATTVLTTTPEMGYNANTEPLTHGSTRNPWDLTRSAAGSSGGSGALIASGAVPMGHANDGGGSIRLPASSNGLVGLKPSRGRVSAAPDAQEGLSGFLAEFALTRSVRDCAGLLDEVSGFVPGDRYRIVDPSRPYSDELKQDPAPLRIAVHTESWAGSDVDPEVVGAVERVADQLEQLGHHVERDTPVFDWDEFMLAHYRIWTGFVAESVAGVSAASGLAPGPDTLEATVLACYEYGRVLNVLEMGEAFGIVNKISRVLGRFHANYDVLLVPTANKPPLPLGYLDANDASLGAEEWTRKIFDAFSFTPLFNLTGAPAMSLPLGTSSTGLPIGVQLTADLCGESTLFALAGQLERAMPWSDRRPQVHVGN